MVEGEEDDESYACDFPDSMINDDKDDATNEDEVKDDDVEKMDDVAKEKDNDDHTDHIIVRTHATGSMEKELTSTVSPPTATTSKTKRKRGFTYNKTKILPGSITGMCKQRDLAVQKDQEIATTSVLKLISKEFATNRLKLIEELFRKHVQNITLNLYPTPSSSAADLQHRLYLNMKSKPQVQAADP
nr:hypothetical protein [Tanacetum cinerariifolium]